MCANSQNRTAAGLERMERCERQENCARECKYEGIKRREGAGWSSTEDMLHTGETPSCLQLIFMFSHHQICFLIDCRKFLVQPQAGACVRVCTC